MSEWCCVHVLVLKSRSTSRTAVVLTRARIRGRCVRSSVRLHDVLHRSRGVERTRGQWV